MVEHVVEIINSESPSTIIEGRWSSRAKEMALTTANASTSFKEDGNLIFSNMEAITLPWWSQTTTPSLASSVSRNTAPSKLIFKLVDGGGFHLMCCFGKAPNYILGTSRAWANV